MDHLPRDFPDAKFSEANCSLFAFAAYNAGTGRISQMRKGAAKRGLDPDKWFNNVEIEIVTAEKSASRPDLRAHHLQIPRVIPVAAGCAGCAEKAREQALAVCRTVLTQWKRHVMRDVAAAAAATGKSAPRC